MAKESDLIPLDNHTAMKSRTFSLICQNIRSVAHNSVQYHLEYANKDEKQFNIERHAKHCFVRDTEFWPFQLKFCSDEFTSQSTIDKSQNVIASTFSYATFPTLQERVATITSLLRSSNNRTSSFALSNDTKSISVNHYSTVVNNTSTDSNSELLRNIFLLLPSTVE